MVSLGIECGATKSTVIVKIDNEEILLNFGPANYSLMSESELTIFLQNVHDTVTSKIKEWKLRSQIPSIVKVALGMAGIISNSQIEVVTKIVSLVWPKLEKIWIGSDIEVGFSYLKSLANKKYDCQLLIISGTGSACFGSRGDKSIKVGGSGHILGDRGSGYAIGRNALRCAFRQYEHSESSPLLSAIMEHLNKKTIPDLIQWSLHADKSCMASLAKIVINYWINYQDEIATSIVLDAINDLSTDCVSLIKKLRRINPEEEINTILIGLNGSILTKCPHFTQSLSTSIRNGVGSNEGDKRVNIDILTLDKESVRGVLHFLSPQVESVRMLTLTGGQMSQERDNEEQRLRKIVLPTLTALSRTEERNPKSTNLDQMSTKEAIKLMLNEEYQIGPQIEMEIDKISLIIEKITNAFQIGGRLFYVGAGTSGRLGILDASECPPTFKAPHHWVQGIIAGGSIAVFKGVEGAEDSVVGGTEAVKGKVVNEKDIVIGIAASGRTPFVWGALYEAKKVNAFAALLTFNPNLKVNPLFPALDSLITVNVGPEILTGSTRLKCGTATKSILNMFTTLSMVRYGKCLENLMVDLNASNDKLRDRAARIVVTILSEEQPNLTKDKAILVLQANEWNVKKTVQLLRTEKNV